jgi:hypothetical protein
VGNTTRRRTVDARRHAGGVIFLEAPVLADGSVAEVRTAMPRRRSTRPLPPPLREWRFQPARPHRSARVRDVRFSGANPVRATQAAAGGVTVRDNEGGGLTLFKL